VSTHNSRVVRGSYVYRGPVGRSCLRVTSRQVHDDLSTTVFSRYTVRPIPTYDPSICQQPDTPAVPSAFFVLVNENRYFG